MNQINPSLPIVGADADVWGAKNNAAHATVIAAVNAHDSTLSSLPTASTGTGVNAVNSGTSFTVSLPSVASTTLVTMTANAQVIFPTPAAGRLFRIVAKQDATGSRTILWPTNVSWPGGTAATLSTVAGRVDVFEFSCYDGANWIGEVVVANVPTPGQVIVTDPGTGGSTGTGGTGTPTSLATETWTGANSGAWPGQWTTRVAGAGFAQIQSNKGRLSTTNTAYGASANASLTGMSAVVDSETYVEVTVPSAAESYISVGARTNVPAGSYSSFPDNGYFLEIAAATGGVATRRLVATAPTTIGSTVTPTGAALVAGSVYSVRLRLEAGRIRWKLWLTSGSEPTTWAFDTTDSTPYSTAGYVYLAAQNGNSTTVRYFDFDNLVVNSTATTTTPTTGVDVTIDETALTYVGSGWQTGTDPGTYNSGDHYSSTTGDTATYTASFVAAGTIAVSAKKANHHGQMSVQIDGGTATTVDLYAAADTYQQIVYTSASLSAGSHTITVTVLGTKNASSTDVVAELDALILHNAVQGTTGTPTGTGTGGGTTIPPATGGGTAVPTGFLTRTGNQIFLNGSQWRAAGTNLPWSLGCGAEVGLTPSIAQMQSLFSKARANSVYRLWMFKNANFATFDAILNAARPYGHRFIPCLADAQAGCGDSSGANASGFYTGGWISNGWRDNWLTPMVNRYKNEPLIAWWEWVNEPSPGQPLRTFQDAVGAYVRNTLGDQHLIGTGTMSEYGGAANMTLVNQSAYVDVCSMHEYDETQYPSAWASHDAADAAAANKPFYVGEYGIKPANDQAGGIAKKLAAYKAMPTCAAVLYWSTAATGFQGASGRYEIDIAGSAQAVINNFAMI